MTNFSPVESPVDFAKRIVTLTSEQEKKLLYIWSSDWVESFLRIESKAEATFLGVLSAVYAAVCLNNIYKTKIKGLGFEILYFTKNKIYSNRVIEKTKDFTKRLNSPQLVIEMELLGRLHFTNGAVLTVTTPALFKDRGKNFPVVIFDSLFSSFDEEIDDLPMNGHQLYQSVVPSVFLFGKEAKLLILF